MVSMVGCLLTFDNHAGLEFIGEDLERVVVQKRAAVINRSEAKETFKRQHDKNVYEPEEEVIIKRMYGEFPKMNQVWKEGPYHIVEHVWPVNYAVKNAKGETKVLCNDPIKPAGVKGAGGSPTENNILFLYMAGRATRCFLPDQKILILAGFIAFSKLQNTYNYLAAARFTRDYLKILNFDTKNLQFLS